MTAIELPRVMPEFASDRLSEPVNLLVKDGDPRKTAYVRSIFLQARQFWLDGFEDGHVPMIYEMFDSEGLLVHEIVPEEAIHGEIAKGRSIKLRGGHYEARKHMVPEHMLTVMTGVSELAELLIDEGMLSENDKRDVIAAAALHDLNKSREFALVTETIENPEKGFGQAGYDQAGEELRQKLTEAKVPTEIIEIAQSVGHTSCPDLEEQLVKSQSKMPSVLLKKLMLHYVDDIVTNPNIIDPELTFDDYGNAFNALDRRCLQNENNPKYQKYNHAWISDPRNKTGETAFMMQRRVGHLVESALANMLGLSDHLQLPAVIYDRIQQTIEAH